MANCHTDPGDTRKGIETREALASCNSLISCHWAWTLPAALKSMMIGGQREGEWTNRGWLVALPPYVDCVSPMMTMTNGKLARSGSSVFPVVDVGDGAHAEGFP